MLCYQAASESGLQQSPEGIAGLLYSRDHSCPLCCGFISLDDMAMVSCMRYTISYMSLVHKQQTTLLTVILCVPGHPMVDVLLLLIIIIMGSPPCCYLICLLPCYPICLPRALPVVHLVVWTVLSPPNIALKLLLAHNTLVLGRAPSLLPTGGSQGTRADNVGSRLILEGLRQQPAPPGAQPGGILVSEFTQMMTARAGGVALGLRLQVLERMLRPFTTYLPSHRALLGTGCDTRRGAGCRCQR